MQVTFERQDGPGLRRYLVLGNGQVRGSITETVSGSWNVNNIRTGFSELHSTFAGAKNRWLRALDA